MTTVLVCGATFGQLYLEALRRPGRAPFECAGLFARGSARARACAEHYAVPLYTDVAEVPGDVDVACVVVRSGLLGGQGSALAQRLMERGMHVVQEHPLHHDELADCLRTARRTGVGYQLNSFYVHVASVRRFLAAAHELTRTTTLRYLDATCSLQTAYSMLEILARLVGRLRPWQLDVAPAGGDAATVPFRVVTGTLGGVPLTMRVQHELDPSNPDDNAHVLHRVTCGTDAGNLTLHDTHGPILWQHRPYFHDIRAAVGPVAEPADHLRRPHVVTVGAHAPSYREIADEMWPDAVLEALRALRQSIDLRQGPMVDGQRHLALCRMWSDTAGLLGPPALRRQDPARLLDEQGMRLIAEAAGGRFP